MSLKKIQELKKECEDYGKRFVAHLVPIASSEVAKREFGSSESIPYSSFVAPGEDGAKELAEFLK